MAIEAKVGQTKLLCWAVLTCAQSWWPHRSAVSTVCRVSVEVAVMGAPWLTLTTMFIALPIYTAAKHGVFGFVRSYGKHLPTEAISLNAVCPNVVRTSIPTEACYSDMQARDLLVPMETVVQAFERCLDTDISGETLEIEPHSGIAHRSAPEPFDKDAADTLGLLHVRGSPLHAPDRAGS